MLQHFATWRINWRSRSCALRMETMLFHHCLKMWRIRQSPNGFALRALNWQRSKSMNPPATRPVSSSWVACKSCPGLGNQRCKRQSWGCTWWELQWFWPLYLGPWVGFWIRPLRNSWNNSPKMRKKHWTTWRSYFRILLWKVRLLICSFVPVVPVVPV